MSSIKNVAIIMDGNGRWANSRSKPRIWGHVKGSSRVLDIVKKSCELNLESLTLYAFSTENWSRPTDEVTNLFKLLKKFLKKERDNLISKNIIFDVIGNYKVLDTAIVDLIDELKLVTAHNSGLRLSLAINYGGRAEVVDAVNSFLKTSATKEVTEEDISAHLSHKHDVDLLIRTAGDQRVSNFLLWQICYAEFSFTETKWPEFKGDEFEKIIKNVEKRDRRFGSINEKTKSYEESKKQASSNLRILS